jgi:outer membrane protein with beta-barrel domain
MRSVCSRLLVVAAVLTCLPAAPCRAQGIGVGGRLSFVKGDASADAPSQRYLGGQIRAWLSQRVGAELSFDRRVEENDLMTIRVRDYPVQASLLLSLARSSFSPYLLGGVGWYTRSVDALVANEVVLTSRTRRTGTHAGIGAELRAGKHAALHGDYRYTFLHFGDDTESTVPTTGGRGFLPSHEGSMWTAGFTIYF